MKTADELFDGSNAHELDDSVGYITDWRYIVELEIKIVTQGAPVVNAGSVYAKGDDVVALEIDLHSKYCEVSTTSGGELPGIFIDATERSLELDKTKSVDESTFIEFPQYAGWKVWCAGIGRYTLSVCLVYDNIRNDAE